MEEHHDAGEPTVQPMSFTDKMINVYAAPGDLFENVRLTGKTPSNWVIPMILFIAVAIGLSQLVLNNPSLNDQMSSMISKRFEENIAKQNMSPEQAEQARKAYESFMKPGSMWFTISQIGGIAVMTPIALLAISLLYWLIGKTAMSAQAPYGKVVEVIGLTFFISIAEQVVTTLLMVIVDNIHATPSAALAVLAQFNPENKLHLALAKLNVFTFWDLSVVSIGLSRLFQRDLPKVLVLVFALWLLWSVATVLAGFTMG
jgi:hypothetical protein